VKILCPMAIIAVLYACATVKKCRATASGEKTGSAIMIMPVENSVAGYAINVI